MVRIGFVNYELGTGGIETLILEICKRLNREHFEPVVFTLCSGGVLEKEFIQAGVPVYGVEKRSGKDLGLIFRLAGQMRKAGVYVVHTHNAIAWLYGGIAARLAGVPFVHTEHTSPDHRAERWRKIEKWMSHLTAQITTVSGSVAQFMIDQEHISSKKVQVVYNGIESEIYEKDTIRDQKREELGLQTGELVLGMVARFFPQKDHRSLLTAFSQIVKQVPQAKLLFMGDGPLRKELEEYGDQLGLNGSVRFLGIRRDIPELLQALDLCILSTHKEGLPIVLLEAMASSKAVVATAVDGCPELVIQGETGFVVPPEDPEALAHSIIELLTDRDQIQRMGLKGRERVRKLFTFEKMMQSYEEIYRSCARKKRVS